MLKQEGNLKTRGLIKVSGFFASSPGIIKHPAPIIVPAPLIEEANTDKIVNEPDQIGVPINPEKDVFAESKPTEEQEETFKKEKLDTLDLPKRSPIQSLAKKRKNTDDIFFDF